MQIRNFKKGRSAALVLTAMVAPVTSFAQIDVTGATGAITDGQTGVITVMTALIVAYGAFLGYRMVKAAVKKG
ncbi:hypothetical protein F3N42_07270 [Marinihelvus fidelis]|uniref:Phage coat protein n=1 Tax=Marinihelvus fidelis TaxID=2613842 RepID=A0A5N0TDP8_9GAMM|nr:major capsid protein [Marinihelvus fidelis]KAA9131966.1 hypothetical protein F3N42_07270 [Marinihelvus fidelis]